MEPVDARHIRWSPVIGREAIKPNAVLIHHIYLPDDPTEPEQPANKQYVDAQILSPGLHKTTHENGGTDEISVTGLSGLLADGQTPLSHAHAEGDVTNLATDLSNRVLTTDVPINVKSFGAIGNGIVDDTNAIETALEVANDLPAGTWETSGDDAYPTRARQPLFFPLGTYRTTRKIPINYFGVSIVGPSSSLLGGATLERDAGGAIILADHADNVFEVDNTYSYAWGLGLQNIALRKTSAYLGQGHGISVIGTNWNTYLSLSGISVMGMDNGVNISTGSPYIGWVTIEKCFLRRNYGYGIYSDDILCVGMIRSNDISQNGLGGISVPVMQGCIIGNNLEGQPSPITISYGHSLTIMNNYAEGIHTGTACIDINDGYNFRVFGNYLEMDVTIPHVKIDNSSQGYVEQDSVVITNSSNITTGSGGCYSTATLNFANMLAGATEELTVTVTGATTTDAAYVSPKATIEAGLIWSAYVSAADTVTIRLYNSTAGAINPASVDWNVGVLHSKG